MLPETAGICLSGIISITCFSYSVNEMLLNYRQDIMFVRLEWDVGDVGCYSKWIDVLVVSININIVVMELS